MNGFQEWLHEEICEYMESLSSSIEEVVIALEAELEVVQQWWEEEQAEFEDEDEDDENNGQCMSGDKIEESCDEQRKKNLLSVEAPNPNIHPAVSEQTKERAAPDNATTES